MVSKVCYGILERISSPFAMLLQCVEIELLATVGWKCGCQPFSCPCSQSVAYCRKDIFSACLSKESMPFVKSKSPLPTRSLRSLRAAAHSTSPSLWLHHAHPFVAAAEKHHGEKERVWSRSCGVQDLLQWWYETAANQRTVVEIELLATVAWKWGCQPFSCPCSKNVTHCPKEIFSTCLSKESMPFVKSKSPLPTRSLRSLRAAAHSTSSALCLHHAHPFVAAAEKNLSHAEKQRVCSRSCGVQDLLQWWYETAANQRTLVEIELLATVAWKWGCQPFSSPCSKNVTHWPKKICSTCLSKESIPAIPLGNAKHPLPTRSLRLLRAAVRSTSSALCLHYACKKSHPFVEDSGFVSHVEKHRFGHGVVVSKVCYGILERVFSHLPR